jgi:hypothetical protein
VACCCFEGEAQRVVHGACCILQAICDDGLGSLQEGCVEQHLQERERQQNVMKKEVT